MELEDYLEKKYSKSTFSSNLYNIRGFTDYYGKRADKATYKDVLQYIEHLRKNYDLHPKTLRHRLYAVKIYFNYLLEIGERKDHPCSELFLKDKIERSVRVDTLYSEETLERFLETCKVKRKSRLQRRNEILISLLIYQGLSVKEISELKTPDINLESGEIIIRALPQSPGSKSPQSRTLPLRSRQILLFYHYLREEREEILRFNKKKSHEESFILGQYGEKINPHCISKMINENRPKTDWIKPMKIRQSVIANLLKKENDIRIVQVFSGHKRASTTQEYLQTDFEILQNAVKMYHPRK